MLDPSNWDSVFRRLDELIMAQSGADSFWPSLKLCIGQISITGTFNGTLPALKRPNYSVAELDEVLNQLATSWPILFEQTPPKWGLGQELLDTCLQALSDVDFASADLTVLDALFERLINRESKSEKGQFFTPRHVVEACVRVLEPKPHWVVADPACGSGAFLSKIVQLGKQKSPKNLWGFDLDFRALAVARLNFILLGLNPNNLRMQNSLQTENYSNLVSAPSSIEQLLQKDGESFQGFNAIVTNPPFAGEVNDASILAGFELSNGKAKAERDVLFLERCVQLLKPGGHLVIVLPTNKLAGKQYLKAREFLLRNTAIYGVVSLPRNTFQPYTGQKAEIVFAVKRKKPSEPSADEKILFFVAEKQAKTSSGELIYRDDIEAKGSAWEDVDHDLGEIVEPLRQAKKACEQSIGVN